MSLFDVQRLLEVWPSLGGITIFKDLFMRIESIIGAWLFQGHVFISYLSVNGGHKLHVFTQVPLRHVSDKGYSQIDITSKVTEILLIQRNTALLVEETGSIQVLQYDSQSFQWTTYCTSMLYVGNGGTVNNVCITCGNNQQLVCSVWSDTCLDEWGNSIYSLSYHIDFDNRLIELSNYNQIMCNCPLINLYPVHSGGVWFVAKSGHLSPVNLMVYWVSTDTCLQPYIWGQDCRSRRSDKQWKDFKVLSRRTACIWSKESTLPAIITFSVHPVSQELMCLAKDGTVYQMVIPKDGSPKPFITLTDFTQRYSSPKVWYSSTVPASLQLFFLHTYLGICQKGEIRLYDSVTGEFIWEDDGLDHPTTRLILHTCSPPLTPVSLWNQSGMYIVRCKKIADHAQMYVESLFPIATNADETTPGDLLENGEIVAAKLCHLWSLNMLGSQYTLKLAYRLLKESNDSSTFPDVPSELGSLLEQMAFRNPSVCVALLSQYPMYRHLLKRLVSKFLDIYNNSDEVHSSLDDQTAPLLTRYLELSEQYESLLIEPVPQDDILPTVRQRLVEILKCSQHSTLSYDPTVALKAELIFLCMTEPSDSLWGIKDFMKVTTTFAEKMKQTEWEEFDFNWRNVLAVEVPENLPEESSGATTGHFVNLPIFEVTVELLYNHEPQDLLDFISFVNKARNLQLTSDSAFSRQYNKSYFYERALEMMIAPTDTSSHDQVHSYCQVLILSGTTCAEVKALNLLLEHSLWSSVLDLLNRLYNEVSPPVQNALFYNTLYHMSKEGVLLQYISSVWPLLPDGFKIHNFMDILKQSYTTSTTDQVQVYSGEDELQVQHVLPYVLDLLSSS